ncbi:MAG: adenine-specific methyltransferase EcoRI family protein [Bacteroidaceae bacterium]|nr:adenine-specific methyltransferase EcoRI family protein [Bacteroidaceae bacterium]
MANKNLHAAKKAKKDEFYTQLTDIERELQHYWPHFRDKVVLCNCDDPYESNFFKYFALRFNQLGLKKLICTCYDGSPVVGTELQLPFEWGDEAQSDNSQAAETIPLYGSKRAYKVEITQVDDRNGDGAVDLCDVQELLKNDRNAISTLKQHGDFRSQECIELLRQADIVVTNPPFSLFREYLAQLVEYDKKFLIIGHQNAITYKEVFPLIKEDKIWLGYGFKGGAAHFFSPYEDIATASDHKKDMIRVSGVNWFTNLDHKKRHEMLDLVCRYSPEEYPKYDNYDAINVDRTSDIPYDYDGVMGVPITFLDKYNPEQFEIVEFRKGQDGKDLVYSKLARGGAKCNLTSEYSSVDADRWAYEQSQRYGSQWQEQICAHSYSTTSIPGMIKNKEGVIGGKITYARILVRRI